MMRMCSCYDGTLHTKIWMEVAKHRNLEGYKICFNLPILILFVILKSGEYVLANKQIKQGSKTSFQ